MNIIKYLKNKKIFECFTKNGIKLMCYLNKLSK